MEPRISYKTYLHVTFSVQCSTNSLYFTFHSHHFKQTEFITAAKRTKIQIPLSRIKKSFIMKFGLITDLQIPDCHVFLEVAPGFHFPPALLKDIDGYRYIAVLFVPSRHAPYALPIRYQKYLHDPLLESAGGFGPGQ